MPEPACPDCGAPIILARDEDGVVIPLERQTEPAGDTTGTRYRVVKFGPPMVVVPLNANARVEGYPDHRADCPAHGNGTRR